MVPPPCPPRSCSVLGLSLRTHVDSARLTGHLSGLGTHWAPPVLTVTSDRLSHPIQGLWAPAGDQQVEAPNPRRTVPGRTGTPPHDP